MAAANPVAFDNQEERICALCEAEERRDCYLEDVACHDPDCPWRLAREWVAAHP